MNAKRILVLYLRLVSAILLVAVAAAVMPLEWMARIHRAAGLGTMPQGLLVEYLARSASLVYATWGAMYLFVSFDIERYLPLLSFACLLIGLFGLGMLVLDLYVGMPLAWTVGEGPMLVLHTVVLRFLLRRVQAA